MKLVEAIMLGSRRTDSGLHSPRWGFSHIRLGSAAALVLPGCSAGQQPAGEQLAWDACSPAFYTHRCSPCSGHKPVESKRCHLGCPSLPTSLALPIHRYQPSCLRCIQTHSAQFVEGQTNAQRAMLIRAHTSMQSRISLSSQSISLA